MLDFLDVKKLIFIKVKMSAPRPNNVPEDAVAYDDYAKEIYMKLK